MSLVLKKASIQDVSIIADLAKEIWHQHYIDIITAEQIDYMLKKMYSHDSLISQQTEKGDVFYLIAEEEHTIGFISVHTSNQTDYFLNKFYLLQTTAGKGVGTHIFRELVKLLNPTSIKLTVNRQNYKSINFYFKNGFIIESVADFDIGNGYLMNDFVMCWKK